MNWLDSLKSIILKWRVSKLKISMLKEGRMAIMGGTNSRLLTPPVNTKKPKKYLRLFNKLCRLHTVWWIRISIYHTKKITQISIEAQWSIGRRIISIKFLLIF
jgi:hypothetical protein